MLIEANDLPVFLPGMQHHRSREPLIGFGGKNLRIGAAGLGVEPEITVNNAIGADCDVIITDIGDRDIDH